MCHSRLWVIESRRNCSSASDLGEEEEEEEELAPRKEPVEDLDRMEPIKGDLIEVYFPQVNAWYAGKVHLRNSDEKQRSGCALIGKGNKFKTCTLRPDHCLVYFAVDDTDYAFSFLIENYDADPDGDQSGDFWRYQTTNPRIDHNEALGRAEELLGGE